MDRAISTHFHPGSVSDADTGEQTAEAAPEQNAEAAPNDVVVERRAPLSWLHWHEVGEAKQSEHVIVEYPVFSDALIVGQPAPFGPYALLNTIAGGTRDTSIASIVLRVGYQEREWVNPDLTVTSDEHYHGGHMLDELAALLSLECGMRVFVTFSEIRRFTPGDDPLGTPLTPLFDRRPPSIRRWDNRVIVPTAVGEHDITGIPLLRRYSELSGADATALVKAARMFQEALWLAESAPELAWVLFVSAVETAAVHGTKQGSHVERLRAWRPKLAKRLLKEGGDHLLAAVAKFVAPVTGATQKFTDFLIAHAPPPAEPRPPEWLRTALDGDDSRLELYSIIYQYRSQALHEGKPFPAPMCEPPRVYGADTRAYAGAISEKPAGHASGYGNVTWRIEDTPILLNTFVHLVRGALLHWWESLLPVAVGREII